MCAPAIIPVLATAAGYMGGTAAGLSGTALAMATASAAASGLSAGAAVQASEYNVNVAKEEKKVAEAEAEGVRQVGATEAASVTQQTRADIARNVAQFGAAGIDPGAGTPGEIGAQLAGRGQLEAMTILSDADRAAWGLEQRASVGVEHAKQQRKAAWQKGAISILGSYASPAIGALA